MAYAAGPSILARRRRNTGTGRWGAGEVGVAGGEGKRHMHGPYTFGSQQSWLQTVWQGFGSAATEIDEGTYQATRLQIDPRKEN